jgi:hypothetical protein
VSRGRPSRGRPSLGRLYPYIPFASSLVWNRGSEDERRAEPGAGTAVKVHVSFSPDWFCRRTDLDYGLRWHRDPAYRQRSFVAMAGALNDEFPELRLGGEPESIRGGISQINTCALVAALFGQEVQYASDQWPENRKQLLDDEAASRLEVPDVAGHPVYEDLMRQIDEIQRQWGLVDGELNYQGVLNTAFRLRGEQIFLDMVAEPRRAHRVLEVVCRTMIALADAVYARQAQTGIRKDYFVTSNCVVNMISEAHYREFVMPYDRALAEHYRSFGIHNCGWRVDAYARAYAEIGGLQYLDFGIDSDLRLLAELFSGAVLTVILNPDDLLGRSAPAVESDLRRLRETLGDCRIILGSLDGGTDSEEVRRFFRIAAAVWGLSGEELVPRPHFG